MPLIQGASARLAVKYKGKNLSGETVQVVATFGHRGSSAPEVTKTRESGDIVVTYNEAAATSTISVTLTATDTDAWAGEVDYTVRIDDGTPGGYWVPAVGGNGTLYFDGSVPLPPSP